MFEDYKEKLEALGANVPKVFSYVAGRGATHFVNEAKKRTADEGLVDTGAYRRNWWAKTSVSNGVNKINVGNDMEYASHLEYGHKLRNGKNWKGRFVGRSSLVDTEGFVLVELHKEIEIAMMQKKFKLSRKFTFNKI